MDLALTPDLEQLIDEQLTRGRLRTPKEVVREALLLLKERTACEDGERLVERIKSEVDLRTGGGHPEAAAFTAGRRPFFEALDRIRSAAGGAAHRAGRGG